MAGTARPTFWALPSLLCVFVVMFFFFVFSSAAICVICGCALENTAFSAFSAAPREIFLVLCGLIS